MSQLLDVNGPSSRLWRWLLIGSVIWMAWLHAPTQNFAILITLHLVAAGVALHFFSRDVLDKWATAGWLFACDTALVALALAASQAEPLLVLLAFAGCVGLSAVCHDRRRARLAGGAWLVFLVGLTGTSLLPALNWSVVGLAPLLMAIATLMHFPRLGEQIAGTSETSTERPVASELWALSEITEMVGKSLELAEVMRSVVHRVGDLVSTDSCSILLVDEIGHNGFVMASKGHPDIDMLELELSKYPEVQQALDSRETVAIQDVANSPMMKPVREFLIGKGYTAVLVLPLVFKGEVLGALTLRSQRPFTADEVRFCKVAAGASANAIKNALLYREMKHEAAENRDKGEKLRRLLDCTPDIIIATDTEGRITEFNDGAENLTGWSTGRALGQPIQEVLDDESAVSVGQGDVTIHREGCGDVQINLVSAPLRSESREEIGRVWVGRDVTKLRRVEKSLAQAERLSSLGEVVAGVAHELNNPLSGVVGYAELLRVQAKEPEQIRDLDRILESSFRCQKIVTKLLSFARQHPPEKKYQSINECVRKVIDLKSYHLRASQIQTTLDLQTDLPDTFFDFHQIEQVILNLLNNGEQAISSLKRPGKIVLRTRWVDDEIFVDVEDDGPGIRADATDRLFDPFFTTKELGEGTGLGLSVSYGIVEEHGGRLETVEPESSVGACLRMRLPIQEAIQGAAAQPAIEPEVVPSPLNGCKILVAEDEPLCLELFARVLRDEGATVTLARDGQEAWEILVDHDFDLIIVDVRMPNLSGKQLYERVAEERPDMLRRFVFATGDLVRPETLGFLQGLPNRILQKPLQMETVRRVLGQAVAVA